MSTFSKRHFEVVAEVMDTTAGDSWFEESIDMAFCAAYRFAKKFRADNAHFDEHRFMVASGFGARWRETFDFFIERIDKEES